VHDVSEQQAYSRASGRGKGRGGGGNVSREEGRTADERAADLGALARGVDDEQRAPQEEEVFPVVGVESAPRRRRDCS
jgi:hypothetical protein